MVRKLSLFSVLLLFSGCEGSGGTITEPEPGVGEGGWSGVAAGTYFSCGTTAGDIPHCWGFYSAAPGSGGPFALTAVPVPVHGAVPLRSISVGGGIGCGLDERGRARCWGREHIGELGNGGSPGDSTRTPVLVQGDHSFAAITVGYSHACAVTRSGEAFCWGDNSGGKLGTGVAGPGTQRVVPTRVTGNLAFASISAGTTQTCGVTTDRRGYCWGGGYGSVGVPHLSPERCPPTIACPEPVPQLVSNDLRFTSISAGNGFTCGVAVGGAGYCWGGLFGPEQRYGVLGSGSAEGSAVPVAVTGGLRFAGIWSGTRAACGITLEGAAYCWGGNNSGELGIGTIDGRAHPAPAAVRGDLRFRSLSLAETSCGLTTDSALYCWGTTYAGLLGNGETRPGARPEPTRVTDPQSD